MGEATRAKLDELLEQYGNEIANVGKDRVEVVYDKVGSSRGSFFPEAIGIPIEVVLALTSAETGLCYNFNNKHVRIQDWGRGIMQVTTAGYVGAGSGREDEEDVIECAGEDCEACYRYYSNTFLGVTANIQDGLHALRVKYDEADNCVGYDGISADHMRWISAIQRYNGCPREFLFWIVNLGESFSDEMNEHYEKGGIPESLRSEFEDRDIQLSEDAEIVKQEQYANGYWGWRVYNPPYIYYSVIQERESKYAIYKRGSPTSYLCDVEDHLRVLSDVFPDVSDDQCGEFADYLKTVYENRESISLASPGEVRIYDSDGNITGLVENEVMEEVANSICDKNSKTIMLFFPFDSYSYEVAGTAEGSYELDVISTKSGQNAIFNAFDIPIREEEIHQYLINWEILSQGGEGVTAQIDFDGDGTPELIITTGDSFQSASATIDFDPDTLNLTSEGKWGSCYIELPEGYNVEEIITNTVRLWIQGDQVLAEEKPTAIGDYNQDGISDLMVKFSRGALIEILKSAEITVGQDVSLTINGQVGNSMFQGTDTIRIVESSDGTIEEGMAPVKPTEFALHQNFRNPLNPDTWIPYQLAEDVHVTIRIYDAAGHLVRTLNLGHKLAGFYITKQKAAYWDGRNEAGEDVASGIYFYTIQAGEFTATRKMAVKR